MATRMALEFYGFSDVGCVRRANEDRLLLDASLGIFAVCDGMGGHRAGATAAELAIAGLRYFIGFSTGLDGTWPFGYNLEISQNANRVATGIKIANRQVWDQAGENPEYTGMGTTIVTVLIDGDTVTIGNVGDSRAYRFRGSRLSQLSVDDTLVGEMHERGLLCNADSHPARNLLTRAAGAGADVEVHIREEELHRNDMLLLCSDGLHGVVGESTIDAVLASGEPVDACLHRMVDAARALGAPDNVSGVLLRYT